MALEKVKEYFKQFNKDNEILVFDKSSATVELASKCVGCSEGEIAKTLSFFNKSTNTCFLVVVAGDKKIDNKKFKSEFKLKAKMLTFEQVEPMVGHAVGGVCPFAINENINVYLDNSLKKYNFVYPACGSSNSAIKLNMQELETYSNFKKWVDVTNE